MLVCSVVLRPKSRTLGAAVTETATATDVYSIGAVFAILADDNATASDYLDGFVGQMMVEAASAAAVVDAGSIRNAAIVEETNALASSLATVSGPSAAIAAAADETTTASSAQDAVTESAGRYAMLPDVFINSSGTPRQANANGIMVNL